MQTITKKLFVPLAITLVLVLAFGTYAYLGLRDELGSTQLQLAETETQLTQTQSTLTQTEQNLKTAEEMLASTESQLQETKLQLTQTESQLIQAEWTLKVTEDVLKGKTAQLNQANASLTQKTAELSQANASLTQKTAELSQVRQAYEVVTKGHTEILTWYAGIRQQINKRAGFLNYGDSGKFVTPQDVEVAKKVLEITGGYSESVDERWADYYRLYRWVVNNIKYSSDSYIPILPESPGGTIIWRGEFWRMPSETLKDVTGDCEDMATLLASMLECYVAGHYTAPWCIGIESSSPDDGGHLAVAFPVEGGKLTILDPAGNFYTNYYGVLGSKPVSSAISEWLSHWSAELPGARVTQIFSDTEERAFESTQEFVDWVLTR